MARKPIGRTKSGYSTGRKTDRTYRKPVAANQAMTDQRPEIPDPADVIKQGAANVLAEVRRGLSTLASEHRKTLYQEVSRAYAVGMVLRADKDEWLTFCHHTDWGSFRNRPKDSDRSDALRYAIRFAVGFADNPKAKKAKNRRVDRLYGALKSFFAEGVSPADIPRKLREGGGFESLKSANAEVRRSAKSDKQAYVTFRLPLDRTYQFLDRDTPFQMNVKLEVRKVTGNRVDAQLIGWRASKKLIAWMRPNPCNTPFAPQKLSNRSKPANDDGTQPRLPAAKPKRSESMGNHRKVVKPR
ncbi:hypothetical protein [Mesorhizobium sp. M0698]|uniref:hypothetical protein n=1 Tax=Mesorhizobium sp. M0698 TaxID=2956987 RepID=UPI0033380CFE